MAFDDLSVRQKIAAIYVGYFGRAADPDGLDYWINDYYRLTAAGSSELDALINIATSFAKNTEATSLYPYLKYPTLVDSGSFIDSVYTNLFGRTADAGGKAYWQGFLGTGQDELAVGKFILAVMRGAQGSDITVMQNRAEVSEYYAIKVATEGANWTLADDGDDARSVISGVTADSATVAAAKSSADTLIAADLAAGSTFTLTTGGDTINGTSGDDTITGGVGTLANMDEIYGGAGTDRLTISFAPILATAGAANTAMPVISGVEIITIQARDASAVLNFTDIRGVTELNVMGNRNLQLSAVPNTVTALNINSFSATLTFDYETATAAGAAYGLTLNMSASTAAQLNWQDDSGNTALVDTLTINAQSDVSLNSGSTFSGVEKIVAAGNGRVTLKFETATAFSDLTANNTAAGIDASNLSGNLSLTFTTGLNATTSNMNIKGGAGNDTFAFNIAGNTSTFGSVTIDGGAGTDTIKLIHSTSDFIPRLSNVETMDLRVSAAALGGMSAVFTAVQGLNTLTLGANNVSAIKITGVASTLNTINIVTSNSTAADLSVFYTGAASSVTLNLGPTNVTSYANPDNGSATAVGFGDIQVSGATGAFSLNVAGTAAFNVDSITLGNFTAATIKAASGNFTLSGNFSGAVSTLTLDASGGSLTFGGIIATAATSVTLNAADGKDISIGCAVLRGGNKLEVILGNTGSDVTINALCAATASSQFELKISGSGNFTLATGMDIGSGITVNLTALSTPGSFNIDFSCATVPICATFGLASGVLYAGKTGDVFVFDNSASHTIVLSSATLTANIDIVKNFGSGDRIVFPGFTATAGAHNTGVLASVNTAGGTDGEYSNTTLSGLANNFSAAAWIAIYTASGNTILEVVASGQATGAAIGSANVYKVIIENFDNAGTAVFRLDTNTALGGLMITLL